MVLVGMFRRMLRLYPVQPWGLCVARPRRQRGVGQCALRCPGLVFMALAVCLVVTEGALLRLPRKLLGGIRPPPPRRAPED